MTETFYLTQLHFEKGRWRLVLAAGTGEAVQVDFSFVRSLSFFKESDFWEDIARYQKRPIGLENCPSCVFQIARDAVSERIVQGRLDTESPLYFGVWTPGECIEVVSFELPAITVQRS